MSNARRSLRQLPDAASEIVQPVFVVVEGFGDRLLRRRRGAGREEGKSIFTRGRGVSYIYSWMRDSAGQRGRTEPRRASLTELFQKCVSPQTVSVMVLPGVCEAEGPERMTGYTRVSTPDEDPQLQLAALAIAGVENRDMVVDETSRDFRCLMAVLRGCCVLYLMGFETQGLRDTSTVSGAHEGARSSVIKCQG